jgi:hypothetical protein
LEQTTLFVVVVVVVVFVFVFVWDGPSIGRLNQKMTTTILDVLIPAIPFYPGAGIAENFPDRTTILLPAFTCRPIKAFGWGKWIARQNWHSRHDLEYDSFRPSL